MAEHDPLNDTLARGRRRMVASILGFAERELYPDLTVEQQERFRDKVLASAAAYSDFVQDVTKGMAGLGDFVNQEVLDLLLEISGQPRNQG